MIINRLNTYRLNGQAEYTLNKIPQRRSCISLCSNIHPSKVYISEILSLCSTTNKAIWLFLA